MDIQRFLLLATSFILGSFLSASPQAYRGNHPVQPAPDGNLYLEAEEFKPSRVNGWEAKQWGENYYAATFANSFLSRKGFLGAPEQADNAVATIQANIKEAGKYLVLCRYEAAYRFETQFRIEVEQNGRKIFNRRYGARENIKIWAFHQRLKAEHAWSWGASENVVWEGHESFISLEPGLATIRLVAGQQPTPAAKRNVDLIMLTRDTNEVLSRIESEKYLPLDGLLTQQGDIYMRVQNQDKHSVKLNFKNGTEHSPYWVHKRRWKPISMEIEAGKPSEWVEVGHLLDTMNDGQWDLKFQPATKVNVEFALQNSDAETRTPIATFTGAYELLPLAYDGNTRYTGQIRDRSTILGDLLKHLKKIPNHGRTPTETLLFAHTFKPEFSPAYEKEVEEFKALYGITSTNPTSGTGKRIDGYTDVRSVKTEKLEEYCLTKLADRKDKIATVSLGDEISLPKPRGQQVNEDFVRWLKAQDITPSDVTISSEVWDGVTFSTTPETKSSDPALYYWSRKYQHHYGIQKTKERTDILRKHLPNAGIGANYSPHYPAPHRYLGEVFKWVTPFRQEAMTQPWSEDYIFQMPVATPQINNINLDLLRAGSRYHPDQKIHYYCMAHWPSNRPDMWRRIFYSALGHGMQIVNLFEFRPVQVAYTENHVTHIPTYEQVLKSYRELGRFENIIQSGRPRAGKVGLWFSEAADIWGDNEGSFAAAKRTLYTAIRHAEAPLDFLVEEDALNGTLDQYEVLYLCDRHVSRKASHKIAEWVKSGGTLFATAGAGMFDETHTRNLILENLSGVAQTNLQQPESSLVEMVKQDLPFVDPINEVQYGGGKLRTFGAESRLVLSESTSAKVLGSFPDGAAALVQNPAGKGTVYTCAFLPGLSYFDGATPKIPVDRSSSEDALVHFLPTTFNIPAQQVIQLPLQNLKRPIRASVPLVETSIVDSPKGTVITVTNWTRTPRKGVTLILDDSFPKSAPFLASGGGISRSGNRITFDLDVADAIFFKK